MSKQVMIIGFVAIAAVGAVVSPASAGHRTTTDVGDIATEAPVAAAAAECDGLSLFVEQPTFWGSWWGNRDLYLDNCDASRIQEMLQSEMTSQEICEDLQATIPDADLMSCE